MCTQGKDVFRDSGEGVQISWGRSLPGMGAEQLGAGTVWLEQSVVGDEVRDMIRGQIVWGLLQTIARTLTFTLTGFEEPMTGFEHKNRMI